MRYPGESQVRGGSLPSPSKRQRLSDLLKPRRPWGKSGADFPLRWFARRVGWAALIAAWAGMIMALLVIATTHYGDGIPTVTTCVTECPTNESPVDPGRPLPGWITEQYGAAHGIS